MAAARLDKQVKKILEDYLHDSNRAVRKLPETEDRQIARDALTEITNVVQAYDAIIKILKSESVVLKPLLVKCIVLDISEFKDARSELLMFAAQDAADNLEAQDSYNPLFHKGKTVSDDLLKLNELRRQKNYLELSKNHFVLLYLTNVVANNFLPVIEKMRDNLAERPASPSQP
jgi:hypothetical protein